MFVVIGNVFPPVVALRGQCSPDAPRVQIDAGCVPCAPDQVVLSGPLVGSNHGRTYPEGVGIVAEVRDLGAVLLAVELLVGVVCLVCEVGLEREMVSAVRALEALLVEDDLVDRTYLLHLVDPLLAVGALVPHWGNEQPL